MHVAGMVDLAAVIAEVRLGRPGMPGGEAGVEPHDAERIEEPEHGHQPQPDQPPASREMTDWWRPAHSPNRSWVSPRC